MSHRLFQLHLLVCIFLALGAGHFVRGEEAQTAPADELLLPEDLFPHLKTILQRAFEQSPRMIERNLERLQSEQQTAVAAARLYPTIGGSFQYSLEERATNNASSVTTNKINYNFGVTQPLFHWGAIRASAQIGKIQAAIVANNVGEAYRYLALEIRAAYLQQIINKSALKRVQFDADLMRRRLEIVKTRIAAGQDPAGATLGIEMGMSEADLNVERHQRSLEIGVRQFQRLTGDEEFHVGMIPDEIPVIQAAPASATQPLRINYVEKRGFMDTHRYLVRELDLERTRLDYRIDRVNLRPKIDLVAGVYQDEVNYTLGVSQRDRLESLFVGVRIGWNIFDGFATRARVRSARLAMRLNELRLAEAEKDLVNAAQDAEKELEFATRSLKHAEWYFGSSQAGLITARDNLTKGRGSDMDVAIAQSGANAGVVAAYQARASYLNTLASYVSTVGADPVVASAREKILNR